jgi:tetratricopeptide (TPR) repeat protein
MSAYLSWPVVRFVSSKLLLAGIVLSACLPLAARADERPTKQASATEVQANVPTKPTKERVEQLIRDLGSPRYATRRAAATELRQVGSEAFDLLYAATDDADPEVAASANYLLRQIPIRWVQTDDNSIVRSIMRQFSQETEAARLKRVNQLDGLSGGAGTAVLCRIARYDRSPLVSRTAALGIIRPSEKPKAQSRPDPDVIERELGASTRPAAQWLHQFLVQQRDPASAVVAWKALLANESARLEKNMGDTSSDIVLGLSWNLADLYRQLGDQPSLNAALDQMIGLAAEGSDETLVSLLAWLTENKSWDVLDEFLTKHKSRLEQSKRPLYYAALARAKQGKPQQADELATKAAAIVPRPNTFESYRIAKDLEQRSKFEWAVREYRQAIDKQPNESLECIIARHNVAALLHDYEHEKEAADILEGLAKDLEKEGRFAQLYARTREYYSDQVDLPPPEEIRAPYHFYRARQYQQEKDWKRARAELDKAIEIDPKNADVLIDMYRLQDADAEWRESVPKKIRELADRLQHEIDENPNDASGYNQWAWLISNTEGDYKQAIRYSHRSLELNKHGDSGAASFLDTLGRCYYAVGDYENAIKYERQAIAKVEHMQVMHRQLALFEKAQADKTKKSSSE